MCYPTPSFWALQQAIPRCAAKALQPSQRCQIGLLALAGSQTITGLADQFAVSRKFVSRQVSIADRALDDAFDPEPADDEVLFYLPVTKRWLRQLVLALVLICHSSLRGVLELLRDLFDYSMSLGTIHNIIHSAVATARQVNDAQDLSAVAVGLHDEMFQARRPVLVGIDAHSTYCYLLSLEEQRDADTWGVRLLELQERGFAPTEVVADAGSALRAAQEQVLPGTPCRSDVFHALQVFCEVNTVLENRAYDILATCAACELKITRAQQRGRRVNFAHIKQRSDATKKQAQAVALADDVTVLKRWLQKDVLSLAGPPHADRVALYDFLVAELQARVDQAPALLGRLVTYLQCQRDDLLAFAAQLDRDFATLAAQFAVAPQLVRELFAVQTLPRERPKRWQRDAPLRTLLGARYYPLSQKLDEVRRRTVRASSLVENYNSRLRSYFFLRRHLGNDYLTLLQFFLNHRRFLRSQHPQRAGQSPAELLTGRRHPHWLEMLGYTRFSRP